MFECHLSRHVNASPEIAFAAASDFARLAEYIPGITRIEILSASESGIGTTFREVRTMFGREATETMTVTAWDPPRSFTLEADSCGCRYASEHRFLPDIAGTIVELHIRTQAHSWFAKLMAPLGRLFVKGMTKQMGADLDALKAEAERRAT